MSQRNSQAGSSKEQNRQAARNAAQAAEQCKMPDAEGFDKKLDGPNRPSI